MSRTRELGELVRMRLLLFLREPEAIFWVFLFPIALALVLSFAFKGRGAETPRVGAVEGAAAARWIEAIDASPDVDLVRFADAAEAERKLRVGAVSALVSGDEPLVVRYDPARPEAELARLRIEAVVQDAAGRVDPVLVAADVVTERGARYIDFLVPGLLGMNLMGTGMWGTGFSIVDMRQKKLLKRLLVTPMRKTSFLLAQMLSRLVFLVLEVVAIAVFGVLVLGVPFRGSLPLFALVCVVGAFCFSGLGLLVASRAQTLEGVSGLMNFVMMPMWLFSGVFFSYERYPDAILPLVRLLPLTALNDALRGLMLEGNGWGSIPGPLAVLVAWTAVTFFLALRIFRWR